MQNENLRWAYIFTLTAIQVISPSVEFEDRQKYYSKTTNEVSPIPVVCEGNNAFCETAPDYPKDLIDKLLQEEMLRSNGPVFELFDHTTHIDKTLCKLESTEFQIDNSSGECQTDNSIDEFQIDNSVDGLSLCTAKDQLVFPRGAKTVQGAWMYVVNHYQYKQAVHTEICNNKGGECTLPDGKELPLAYGYNSSCVQKFMTIPLAALSASRNKIEKAQFKFPSCCQCQIYKLHAP